MEKTQTPWISDRAQRALTHTLTLRLASIRRCNHCWTSASNQPTARPPRLTDFGKVPCAMPGKLCCAIALCFASHLEVLESYASSLHLCGTYYAHRSRAI